MIEDSNIHFIVGMSRAGTTWLMECLNQHSQIVSFGETGYWGVHYLHKEIYGLEELEILKEKYTYFGYANPGVYDKYGGGHRIISNALDDLKLSAGKLSPKAVFIKIASAFAELEGKVIAVEKTPHHVNHLNLIRSNFPDSKIMIHQREAESFMLSYKHQGDRQEESIRKAFERNYHPLACVLIYNKYKRSITKAARLDKTLLLEMQEIIKRPDIVLKNVQLFLGVSLENIAIPKTNSSFPKGEQMRLSLEDVFWLRFFGYQYSGKLKVRDLILLPFIAFWSIIKLPYWSFNVLQMLKRRVGGIKGGVRYLAGFFR